MWWRRTPVYEESSATTSAQDDVVALPRDPHSLFFFWDVAPKTAPSAEQASSAVLRVYDGDVLIREVPFAPERRSFYLHDLPAGRTFRLEAHVVDASGTSRRVGAAKLVTLPADRPVRTTEVRFLKLPWHQALSALNQYLREGRAEVQVVAGQEAFSAWLRTGRSRPGRPATRPTSPDAGGARAR